MKIKLLAKRIFFGCESRGDADSPYMTRITLLETPLGAVYIHRFHRSDSDEHHDHPWAFISIILWRGYYEETLCDCDHRGPGLYAKYCYECLGTGKRQKRMWPGMILFRRAIHRHRVELVEKRGRLSGHPTDVFTYPAEAWTLIIRGPYIREWGFFTKQGWQHWKEYFLENGCGKKK